MKISFCLTTYNKKEFLEITLNHYITNRKDNYELIVSDGCSTDGTVEYLKKLKSDGVIDTLILSEQRDDGEWEGFKKTLDHVTGQYFYLLTDDDYFDFTAIDKIAGFLENHQEIDYLIANGIDIRTNGTEVGLYHQVFKNAGSLKTKTHKRFEDGACGLGLFVKSELIKKLDLFSPKFGKRTDKAITVTLMDSDFLGATSGIRTYAGIKNEKSNSHLYAYNYKKMEDSKNIEALGKDFLCDTELFKKKFESAQKMLHGIPNPFDGEIVAYRSATHNGK